MLLAALKIFTTALSISTAKLFRPATNECSGGRSQNEKQVGINMGKLNHPVLDSLPHSEIGFLTRIEGLNEVRGLKNQVSASRTIVKTRVVQEFVPDEKRGFYNKRAYG